MKEILYLEVPTPDTAAVRTWLQHQYCPSQGRTVVTPDGIRLELGLGSPSAPLGELSVFVWSVQRTTYLKVFRWSDSAIASEPKILDELTTQLRNTFPYRYPEPPEIDLSQQSIFAALAPHYPLTVKYFQKMPNGQYDLQRVYWWEKRWRDGVRNPQTPQQVIFKSESHQPIPNQYDLIYIGGALGSLHAAVMARLGYRVLLVERMPFGRMHREWNISRQEFQSLIDLGLFTPAEFEELIAREYVDGFNKFFDSNIPQHLKAKILHTPTVLNIALDSEKLLRLCGQKLRAAGGEICDETEFIRADVGETGVVVSLKHLPTGNPRQVTGRLLVDAMGTASPIAWQFNGKRAFDSVCPTVGGVVEGGFAPEVWDADYGDVLNSHGDVSRGRQLIWELFPGEGNEFTIYLFHYHQVHPENPGSLLEMYEDFFTILPEYRRCNLDELVWKKPTFGYIPGHFSVGSRDRTIAFDRLVAIGDAASLQSPLVFTGFGSLVRNLHRLTHLLDVALKHDLLQAKYLNAIHAYQSNVAIAWLFSKGMMVPTGRHLPPERVNAMLNTFFGLLADQPPEVADTFIKDRIDWLSFNRLAVIAAFRNPALIAWIWDLAGAKDFIRWVGAYLTFTLDSLISAFFASWFPGLTLWCQPWLENRLPQFWFWMLTKSYSFTAGIGQPQKMRTSFVLPHPQISSLDQG